jgi:outer membrane protein assembly factor BamB
MMSITRRAALMAACVFALNACSTTDDKAPLPGERISVLALQKTLEVDNEILNAEGFVVPEPWKNEFWPQSGGYPNHAMQNLYLNGAALQAGWRTSIGEGSKKDLPLTAQPIIVDEKVITLDTKHRLRAFNVQTGKEIWTSKMKSENEKDPVIGGGVSYSQGQLFITNGYNEVISANPADGSILWRARLPAPSRAAPTVLDGRLFVNTMDNRVVALDATDGSILWQFSGVSTQTALLGAPSPAANGQVVIPAFSSGEIFALRVENGGVAWNENLTSARRTAGLQGLTDIRGLPVIDKGLVFAISFGGLMTAIDERTGNRVWQREVGGAETPWVAGNHVFVISSDNQLVALGRDNGAIRWVTALPRYKNEEKRRNPISWTGPVLAGGRLIVAGSHGRILEIIPQDGIIVRDWEAGDSFRIAPAVANGVLYLLDNNGTLRSFK